MALVVVVVLHSCVGGVGRFDNHRDVHQHRPRAYHYGVPVDLMNAISYNFCHAVAEGKVASITEMPPCFLRGNGRVGAFIVEELEGMERRMISSFTIR